MSAPSAKGLPERSHAPHVIPQIFWAAQLDAVIIEIPDARTGKGMWRGEHDRAILDKASDDQRKARLEKAIEHLLRRFPPN